MTVNTESNKIIYDGNGSNTNWSFSFATPNAQSITVVTQDVNGILTVQSPGAYSIVVNAPIGVNPTPVGGMVTFPLSGLPLQVGTKIAIVRELDPIQPVSLTNQSIMYPTVIEKELDYLTMLDQQGSEVTSRAFTANIIDPVPRPTPPIAERANHFVFFDANGDLVPGGTPSGSVFISAAMEPVVGAPTLSEARQAMGIRTTKTITGAYGVTTGDNGTFFNLIGNAFYTVTFNLPILPLDFVIVFMNNDTRGKLMNFAGTTFILWPTQSVIASENGTGTGYVFTKSGRWRTASVTTFNVDFVNGNDANDGLGTVTQAFKTIQQAVNTIENECDGPFKIQLAAGTHNVGGGVSCSKPLPGSAGYSISGNNASPGSVKLAATGGACLVATNNASLTISGMEFSATGTGHGLIVINGAIVNMSFMRFGSAPGGYQIDCSNNAILNITGPYAVLSGATATIHLVCEISALVSYAPGTVTFEGACSLGYFWYIFYVSTLWSQPTTFVNPGFVTASQYQIGLNSIVVSAGNVVPGNTAGVVSTGGIFF